MTVKAASSEQKVCMVTPASIVRPKLIELFAGVSLRRSNNSDGWQACIDSKGLQWWSSRHGGTCMKTVDKTIGVAPFYSVTIRDGCCDV